MSDSPASTAVISAPAKINLYFNVIGKRPDGYHLIDSLIGFTALGDVLTIRGDAPLDIDCDGPFAGGMPPADQNLVYRAAQRLADAAGVPARGRKEPTGQVARVGPGFRLVATRDGCHEHGADKQRAERGCELFDGDSQLHGISRSMS